MKKAKVVLLTGASSGIGAELAKELARQGRQLILTARRIDRLEQVAAECRAIGAAVRVIPADLADTSQVEALVAAASSAYEAGLDVLINNAGYGLSTSFADSDPAELQKQINVNLTSPVLLARNALPALIKTSGTIINIGSSITAMAIPAFGIYGATKAGFGYWSNALRREVRNYGVTVCLVEPGPVKTEFLDVVEANPNYQPRAWEARPPAFLCARADDAARRIARLIDHPKRRISMLRRTVWPLRWFGAIAEVVPGLTDKAF
jgi:hypothetical protein